MSKLNRKLRTNEKEFTAIKAGLIAVLITVAAIIIMDALGTSLKELF